MVYKLGMGPNTGLVAFDERESGGAVSAELHAAMDRDVRLIVDLMYTRVRAAIEGHCGALEALAEALLDRETLEGNDALEILQAHGVSMEEAVRRRAMDDRPPPARRPGMIRG
jgi:ATP-dependent Zn protease